MALKGYMKMPLDGDSVDEMVARVEFTGDWRSTRKRINLMSKPRHYKATVHFITTTGQKAVETYDIKGPPTLRTKGKTTPDQVGDVVKEYALKVCSENPEYDIDLYKSYACIRNVSPV